MKISAISLTDFRSHGRTILKGLRRVNVLLGPNGAGKSTILDGISYGLYGLCRGLTRGGAGSDFLARRHNGQKSKGFAVELFLEEKSPIKRGLGDGPRSKAQDRIGRELDIAPAMLAVLTDPTTFMGLSQAEQRELLMQVTKTGLSEGQVEETIGDDENILALLSGYDLTTLEGVRAAEAYVRNARPDLKRRLAEMGEVAVDMPERDPEQAMREAADYIADLRKQRDKRLAVAEEAAGRHQEARRRLSDARRAMEQVEAAGKQAGADPAKELKTAEAELVRLDDAEAKRAKVYMVAQQAVQKLEADLGTAREQYARFVKIKQATCPTCTQKITEKTRKAVQADLQKKGKNLTKDLAAAQKKLDALKEPDADAARRLRSKIECLRAAVADRKQLAGRREAAQKALQQAEQAEQECPAPMGVNVDDIDKEIAEGEAFVAQQREIAGALERSRETLAKQRDLKAKIAACDEAAKKVGPKGPLQQHMLSSGLGALAGEVSALATAMGLPEVVIKDQADRVNPLQIFAGGLPATMLSTSEKYRLSFAIAAVLAKRSGAGILCLDGAEVLDHVSRDAVNDILDRVGLEQAFVAATPLEMPQGLASDDDWAYYAVGKKDGVSAVVRL